MSDNYIVINGKRVELTDEQVKALGIETRKNPFERVEQFSKYYRIADFSAVDDYVENNDSTDQHLYASINYFNDKEFAQQVALHQLLYRKLLKFAYDNECEDTAEWNGTNKHWFIRWSCDTGNFIIFNEYCYKGQEVYFSSDEAAKRAGREVVEPFMKEHPEFVW